MILKMNIVYARSLKLLVKKMTILFSLQTEQAQIGNPFYLNFAMTEVFSAFTQI